MEKRYYFVFSAGAVLVIDREQNASIAECQNSFQAGKIVDALNQAEKDGDKLQDIHSGDKIVVRDERKKRRMT
jgi:hypothetical protein